MLKNTNAKTVQLFLGEPIASLRQGLRVALHREGYESVEDFDKLMGLRDAVGRRTPDALIIDSEMGETFADVIALVRGIRLGHIGSNPYLPTIVTLWNPTRQRAKEIVDSGADDLLLKPISPSQLFERLHAIATRRKPFIVTSDYIGPDRRKDTDRKSNIPLIEAPNSLQAKLAGDHKALTKINDEIADANKKVNDQRLKRNAFQISFLIDLLYRDLGQWATARPIMEKLDRMVAVAQDITERVRDTDPPEVIDLTGTLLKLTKGFLLQGTEPPKKDIDLLKTLSEGILLALHPNEKSADLVRQIGEAVAGYLSRQEQEKVAG